MKNEEGLRGDNQGFKTYRCIEDLLVLGTRALIAICRLLRRKLPASCSRREFVSSNKRCGRYRYIFFERARQSFCDQIGAPTCANDIAAATTRILTGIYTSDKSQTFMSPISGTYHMTAAGATSWFNFAKAILGKAPSVSPKVPWFAAATQDRPLIAKRILPISSDEFRSPTRRPIYSVLSNVRLSEIFHIELPN